MFAPGPGLEIDVGSVFPEQFPDRAPCDQLSRVHQEKVEQPRRLRLQTDSSAVLRQLQRYGAKLEDPKAECRSRLCRTRLGHRSRVSISISPPGCPLPPRRFSHKVLRVNHLRAQIKEQNLSIPRVSPFRISWCNIEAKEIPIFHWDRTERTHLPCQAR